VIMAASKMQPIFSIWCINFQSARCINLHPALTRTFWATRKKGLKIEKDPLRVSQIFH